MVRFALSSRPPTLPSTLCSTSSIFCCLPMSCSWLSCSLFWLCCSVLTIFTNSSFCLRISPHTLDSPSCTVLRRAVRELRETNSRSITPVPVTLQYRYRHAPPATAGYTSTVQPLRPPSCTTVGLPEPDRVRSETRLASRDSSPRSAATSGVPPAPDEDPAESHGVLGMKPHRLPQLLLDAWFIPYAPAAAPAISGPKPTRTAMATMPLLTGSQ
mmetsp:Transcript_6903/g.18530  ORF Transcript_6903/g.18530 Transcript_6903/m.18530 type:complete len:214 (+) Transcript_6903:1036-1677(+)